MKFNMKNLITSLFFIATVGVVIGQQNSPKFSPSSESKPVVSTPITTGNQELKIDNFTIYSYGKTVYISSKDFSFNEAFVTVCDLSGKLLVNSQLSNQTLNTLNLNSLKTGIYIVGVNIDFKRIQSKIFIK
tara:strand:- start:360 stop:752 length:393 start_codon:yes stop_codon:yes gene_type:complete